MSTLAGLNGVRALAGGLGVRGGLKGGTSIVPALCTTQLKPPMAAPLLLQPPLAAPLHTSATTLKEEERGGPRKWKKYNDVRYPPTPIGEKERHAVSTVGYGWVWLSICWYSWVWVGTGEYGQVWVGTSEGGLKALPQNPGPSFWWCCLENTNLSEASHIAQFSKCIWCCTHVVGC